MKETEKQFLEAVEEAKRRLAAGEKPENIFDAHYMGFDDGFAIMMVRMDSKWNFINHEGNYLSDKWFDSADNFHNGFAQVSLNGKWNFIDHNGNILSDKWFDICGNFHEEFAKVKLNNKWNYVDSNGNYLSNTWFDWCGNFHEGFACVVLNDKWNYVDSNGNILSDTWFDDCWNFNEGFAPVVLNGKNYRLRKDGVLCDYDTKEPVKPVSPDIDYKKKYEEALQRARVVNPGTDDHNIVTAIFPELKESEDDRIKTNIIKYLRFVRDTYHQYDECNEAIAWLEKSS